jgi:predicted GNAT family N-acyltransferase
MGRGYTTSARIMEKGQKTEKKLNEETTAKSQHTMRLRSALLSTKVEKSSSKHPQQSQRIEAQQNPNQ